MSELTPEQLERIKVLNEKISQMNKFFKSVTETANNSNDDWDNK